MRILKCVAISTILVVAGCSSSDNADSPGATNAGTTTTAATTTTAKGTSKTPDTVPKGSPSAPREVSGAPFEAGVIKLFWKAPKSSGNAPIAAYIVTSFYGSTRQKTKAYASTATQQTISGLQNGYAYTFEVAATNETGTGPFSKRSGPVTVGAPGIPQNVKAANAAKGSLRVSFETPGDSGAEITHFTAACKSSNGGATQKVKGGASPITVVGLSGGRTYTCTVTATNSRGTGPLSPASNKVVIPS
jgi:hypothetical protein